MHDRGRLMVLSTLTNTRVPKKSPPRQLAFEIAEQLSRTFAQTAVERDKHGGTAKVERGLLRASGLLNVTIPAGFGGWGMDWPDTMKLIRNFAGLVCFFITLFG